MANYRLVERLLARLRITMSVYRLGSGNYRIQLNAVEQLRAAGTRCWPQLRRRAFRGKHIDALRAASLLHDMGDEQGLWALMELLGSDALSPEIKKGVRAELERIGQQEIISSLETALDRIDQGQFMPSHWSLALCVHCLKTVDALGIRLNEGLWFRLLTLQIAGLDGSRECRAVTPVTSDRYGTRDLDSTAWPAGTSLVQIRRCAVDILLRRGPETLLRLLKQSIHSSDRDVQLTAIHGLWRLGDRQAVVLLQPIAASRQHPYYREARRAIESFGSSTPEEITLVRPSLLQTEPDELLRPSPSKPAMDTELLLRPGDESCQTGA